MSVRVVAGDCREVVPALGIVFDSVVTDPPYDLVAMTKRFGKGYAAAKSPDHQRFAKGFMGQQWDGEGVAFDPETWRIIGSALRPGGFLLAFGAPRTHRRLACAIEDAGFIIQDCLMWLFGTGFPKRKDMLKPAYEPIVLAYKPGAARTMQVDECRIGYASAQDAAAAAAAAEQRSRQVDRSFEGWGMAAQNLRAEDWLQQAPGRWPANICHDGSDDVVSLFPQSESGDSARFFWSAKAGRQDRWGSRHPTVKPVELMKWLIALVTPPGGLVLDPFAGSGTTGIAAMATGRDAILVEREQQYLADIRERMAFYEGAGAHSVKAKNRSRKADAGPLFASQYDPEVDSIESYNAAIRAIGEQVKAGAPVPEFFRSERGE